MDNENWDTEGRRPRVFWTVGELKAFIDFHGVRPWSGEDVQAFANILNLKRDEVVESLRKALSASEQALRSYQCGNSSTELAEEIADFAKLTLTETEHHA